MKKVLSLFLMALWSLNAQAQADLQLNNKQSAINFVSIKKSTVGEVHHFKSLSGTYRNGEAKVEIDLSSVETSIPIRNKRMQNMLFDVSQYPLATITTKLDSATLDKLNVGQYIQEKLDLTLNLHGIVNKVSATVNIVKLSNNVILVYSVYPVMINASD